MLRYKTSKITIIESVTVIILQYKSNDNIYKSIIPTIKINTSLKT